MALHCSESAGRRAGGFLTEQTPASRCATSTPQGERAMRLRAKFRKKVLRSGIRGSSHIAAVTIIRPVNGDLSDCQSYRTIGINETTRRDSPFEAREF